MVDRASRDELAWMVRRLVAGLVTDDFADAQSDRLRHSRDLGVQAVRLAAAQLHEDLGEEGVDGPRALGKAGRRPVAHWLLFLKSDLEYDGVDLTGWRAFVLSLPKRLCSAAGGPARAWQEGDPDAKSAGRR
jgi:hypothetical protein